MKFINYASSLTCPWKESLKVIALCSFDYAPFAIMAVKLTRRESADAFHKK